MLELLTGRNTVEARTGNGSIAAGSIASKVDESELFLLWAVRQWMRAHHERRCATGEIFDAFEISGMVQALGPLNRLMTLLTIGCRRRLAISGTDAAPISIDERLLLGILRAARDEQADLVESRLSMWMEGAQAAVTGQAARHLADAIFHRSTTIPGICAQKRGLPH